MWIVVVESSHSQVQVLGSHLGRGEVADLVLADWEVVGEAEASDAVEGHVDRIEVEVEVAQDLELLVFLPLYHQIKSLDQDRWKEELVEMDRRSEEDRQCQQHEDCRLLLQARDGVGISLHHTYLVSRVPGG